MSGTMDRSVQQGPTEASSPGVATPPVDGGAAAPPGADVAPGPAAVAEPRTHISRILLVGTGVLLLSAWGGIAPFVAPAFGLSPDGTGSWTWSLAHALLALVPGAVGILAALGILGRLPEMRHERRRTEARVAGLLAVLCGAWFIFGPTAWPVLHGSEYFPLIESPWGTMIRELAFAFGPGILIAAGGAYAMGWAGHGSAALGRIRHLHGASATTTEVAAPDTTTEMTTGSTPA